MKQDLSFVNLTTKQRVQVFREATALRERWITREFLLLVKAGTMPRFIFEDAYQKSLEGKAGKERAAAWLKENGYEVIVNDGDRDFGAVLKCRGRVIAKLEIDVEKKAALENN